MRSERPKLSRHAEVAKAIDYMLKRWPAFTRFIEDGRICLTNNAERALRGVALGRKSWLFVGSTRALHAAHLIMSLIDRVNLAGGCQAAGGATAVHRLGGVFVSLEIGLANDPGSAFAVLVRRENSLGDEAADGRRAYGEGRRGLVECRLAAVGALAVTVDGDAILTAQGATRPRVQLLPWPVDLPDRLSTAAIVVGHLTRQGTNEINHLRVGGPSRLTRTVPLHRQTGGRRLCQWTISSNVSPTVSTMISEMTVRMIFLRSPAWCRLSKLGRGPDQAS